MIIASGYNPSFNPKTTCTTDADGDSKPNHQDSDSDGDGCSDARESGATTSTVANFQFTGTMGTNGFDNSLETAADTGVPNFTPTYSAYALVASLNGCTDTDGDGVPDLVDIDDDNDGILDHIESGSCFLSASEWNLSLIHI